MDWLRIAEILCMIIAICLWGVSIVRIFKFEKEENKTTSEVLLKYSKKQVIISFGAAIFSIAMMILGSIGS